MMTRTHNTTFINLSLVGLEYNFISVLVTLKPYKSIFVFQWFGTLKMGLFVGGSAPKPPGFSEASALPGQSLGCAA